MPEYVVTRKAFAGGRLLEPGDTVTLQQKPSWAEKKSKGGRPKKQEAEPEKPKEEDYTHEDFKDNPTVTL